MTGEWLPPKPPGADEPLPGQPPEYPQQQPPQQQPPPGYWQPQQAPPPAQPPNNDAVAGFTCGIIGASLLFFTLGLSTIVSLGLGIAAIPFSRKGKRNVEEGRTPKHKGLADAGYIIGIVTLVLSLLATLAWILLFTLIDWDEIDESDDDPFDDEFRFEVLVRTFAAAVRLVA